MGLSSAGSRGLLWAPVDVLVRISADGRTPGDPVQGPSPGRLDYWALVRWSDGPLRRRDAVCRRAIAAPWWFWSGAPVGREGRDSAFGRADVRGWEIAWGGSSEPGATVSTECWTGALDGRICRGLDWRVASGAPYPSQDMPSARRAGREPGQPGLARGSPEARPGP